MRGGCGRDGESVKYYAARNATTSTCTASFLHDSADALFAAGETLLVAALTVGARHANDEREQRRLFVMASYLTKLDSIRMYATW